MPAFTLDRCHPLEDLICPPLAGLPVGLDPPTKRLPSLDLSRGLLSLLAAQVPRAGLAGDRTGEAVIGAMARRARRLGMEADDGML